MNRPFIELVLYHRVLLRGSICQTSTSWLRVKHHLSKHQMLINRKYDDWRSTPVTDESLFRMLYISRVTCDACRRQTKANECIYNIARTFLISPLCLDDGLTEVVTGLLTYVYDIVLLVLNLIRIIRVYL